MQIAFNPLLSVCCLLIALLEKCSQKFEILYVTPTEKLVGQQLKCRKLSFNLQQTTF